MTTFFRGGNAIWINNEDATAIGVEDNELARMFQRERGAPGKGCGESPDTARKGPDVSCAGANN